MVFKASISVSKLFPSIKKNVLEKIDLSVSTKFIEPWELSDLEVFQYKIEKL